MCAEWNTRVFCGTLLISFLGYCPDGKRERVMGKGKKWEKYQEQEQKRREYSWKREFCFEDEHRSQPFFLLAYSTQSWWKQWEEWYGCVIESMSRFTFRYKFFHFGVTWTCSWQVLWDSPLYIPIQDSLHLTLFHSCFQAFMSADVQMQCISTLVWLH